MGAVADATVVVTKHELVQAAQSDAASIRDLGIARPDLAKVTGQFMGRSAAKALARLGLSLARVQWYGQWGSVSVMEHMEEAAEESERSTKPGSTV